MSRHIISPLAEQLDALNANNQVMEIAVDSNNKPCTVVEIISGQGWTMGSFRSKRFVEPALGSFV